MIRLGCWIAKPYRHGWMVAKTHMRERDGETHEELSHRSYPRGVCGACASLEAAILREYGPQAHRKVRGLLNAISDGRQEANVQLDLIAETEARDEALRHMDSAHRWWITLAVEEIRRLARVRPELTSADVWQRIRPEPPERRAMGSAFRQAQRLGLLKPTDHYVPQGSHGRPIRVWKSLVFDGER